MSENELSKIILDISFDIHKKLGPGLFESIYEEVMAYELENTYKLYFERQKSIPVWWKGKKLEPGFKLDIIVGNKIIVELKSIEKLVPVHSKQVQTYLRLTGVKLGLLINFNEALLKHGIKRIVNGLEDQFY